ncbi:MAG: gfo/Idh/MocA family oxidoreductase, partial [Chloroflexi bacterium]|nr:gfo/Idh/MocA family oxidoreductase [Chloroflexota bacterium]
PRREISVNTNHHTFRLDLIKNTLEITGVAETISLARDDTYRTEHQAMLAGNAQGLCTLAEALETLTTIEAAEQAAKLNTWIVR